LEVAPSSEKGKKGNDEGYKGEATSDRMEDKSGGYPL
jgi:hypothetical protein